MKYPETFSDDLKYLSQYYKWGDEEKKEIKEAFRDSEPMVRFLTALARAHQAGYSQHAGNNFQRLQSWCAEKGLTDPFGPEFDLASIDSI